MFSPMVPNISPREADAVPDIEAGKFTPNPCPLIPATPEVGLYAPEKAEPGAAAEPPIPPGVTYNPWLPIFCPHMPPHWMPRLRAVSFVVSTIFAFINICGIGLLHLYLT